MKQWPKVGSKITYKGTHTFWFTNIIKDANEFLEVGKEYTICKLELASSWCGVVVEEFPEKKFALSFFTYDKDLTTEEIRKLEQESWEAVEYEHKTLKDLKENKLPPELKEKLNEHLNYLDHLQVTVNNVLDDVKNLKVKNGSNDDLEKITNRIPVAEFLDKNTKIISAIKEYE